MGLDWILSELNWFHSSALLQTGILFKLETKLETKLELETKFLF
jgi:hypothetical protein